MRIPTEIQKEFRDAAKKTLEKNGMRMEDVKTMRHVRIVWGMVRMQQREDDNHPIFVRNPEFKRAIDKLDSGADILSRIRALGFNDEHLATMLRSVFGLKKLA